MKSSKGSCCVAFGTYQNVKLVASAVTAAYPPWSVGPAARWPAACEPELQPFRGAWTGWRYKQTTVSMTCSGRKGVLVSPPPSVWGAWYGVQSLNTDLPSSETAQGSSKKGHVSAPPNGAGVCPKKNTSQEQHAFIYACLFL